MESEKLLIACLRHRNMLGNDFLLFWGPNRGGYVTNVHNAGLYDREEAEKICDTDDVAIPLSFLGLSQSDMEVQNKDVWKVVFKTDRVLRFIDQQVTKNRIKDRLKKKGVLV